MRRRRFPLISLSILRKISLGYYGFPGYNLFKRPIELRGERRRQRKHTRHSIFFRHVEPPHRLPQDEDIGPPLYDTSFLERLHQKAGASLRRVLQNAPEAQGLRPLESKHIPLVLHLLQERFQRRYAGRIPPESEDTRRSLAPLVQRLCLRRPGFSGHNARPGKEKPRRKRPVPPEKIVCRKGEQADFKRLAQRWNTHRELRPETDARPRGKTLRELKGDSCAIPASGEDGRYGNMRNKARSSPLRVRQANSKHGARPLPAREGSMLRRRGRRRRTRRTCRPRGSRGRGFPPGNAFVLSRGTPS